MKEFRYLFKRINGVCLNVTFIYLKNDQEFKRKYKNTEWFKRLDYTGRVIL